MTKWIKSLSAIVLVVALLADAGAPARAGISAPNVELNARGTNVQWFGAAGDGTTDSTTAIQSAVNSSNNIIIPSGSFVTTGTITLKANQQILLEPGAVIKPTGNFNVFQVMPGDTITGGDIDTSADPSFQSSGLYFDGSKHFNAFPSTSVKNIQFNGGGTGNAIELSATTPGAVIQWINFSQININNFYNAVLLTTSDPSSGIDYINGNNFSDFTINSSVNGFILRSPNDAASAITGNIFNAFQIETASSSSYDIYVSGNDNIFTGLTWDIKSDNNVTLSSASGSNTLSIKGAIYGHYHDFGIGNIVDADPYNGNQQLYESAYNGNLIGEQDNFLSFADKRFTVTFSPAPTSGNISNLFDLTPNDTVAWNSAAAINPIVITINFNGAVEATLNYVGFIMSHTSGVSEFPAHVTIDGYNADTSSWQNIVTHTITPNGGSNLATNYIVGQRGPGIHYGQLRFTFQGVTNNNPEIAISKLIANFGSSHGNAWLSTGGGNLYGNLNMRNNYLVVGNVASLPKASSDNRGDIILVLGGRDTTDTLYISLKSAANSYSWVPLTTGG